MIYALLPRDGKEVMRHYKSGKVPEVREDRSASAEILPSFLCRERPLFLLGRYRLVKYRTFQSSPPKAKLVVTGTPFFTVARAMRPAAVSA
jgi:hypothetical protein